MAIRDKQTTAEQSTQRYLKIGEIHDNTLILKDGSLRSVLEVQSMNFHLKSEEEQNAIIYSYQGFLNTLEFPIQITVQSRRLNIDAYISSLETIQKTQPNELLANLTLDYTDYMKKLVEYADIMANHFYVIVPYDTDKTVTRPGILQQFLNNIAPQDTISKFKIRMDAFEDDRKKLSTRMSVIRTGLEACNLKTRELTTPELIELFYEYYNPLTARNQKITDYNESVTRMKGAAEKEAAK